ncbi:MAG: hypothetical protein AB1938_04360 [Myxococcota bacterium]
MQAAVPLDAPQLRQAERRGRSVTDVRIRRLLTLFRARLRVIRARLDPTTGAAVALLPALFHATFPWVGLKSDAPGVEDVRASMRWMKLARDFDLPPPTGIQRGRRLVAALLITPHDAGLDVHVVPAPNLTPADEQRIAQRARAVETLLRRRLLAIAITATGPSAQPYDAASKSRLLSGGALLAGRLPDAFFTSGGPSSDPLAAELWRTAPTEAARVMAHLTLDGWPSGEAAELEEVADLARAVAQPLWHFADAGLFMAARAALRSKTPSLPFSACALATPEGAVRRTARALALHLGAPKSVDGATPAAILEVGRALALELTRAVRRLPREDGAALRTSLAQTTLGAGFPRLLMAPLAAALTRAGRRGDLPPLREVQGTRAVEVRLTSGGVLGQGARPAQAWVRALALLGQVLGRPVAPAPAPPEWKKLAPRLLAPASRRTLVLDVAPLDVPGPPYDPLNRGEGRRLALSGGLLVSLKPRGRPSAREVRAVEVARLFLREALAGTQLDFVARGTEVQSLEARLTRLARRVRAQVPTRPMAVEVGGDVVVVAQDGFKQHPEPSFARRPVRCAFDPEAPDFGADATQGRDVPAGPQLQCFAWCDDEKTARLLTTDDAGRVLRETVPLVHAEAWLSEAQALLRAEPQAALSVRAANGMTRAALALPPALAPDVVVALKGRLPFGLELELDGERYGGPSALPWSAAALTILSKWPPGVRGRICFAAVDVLAGEEPASGLLRLYARSLALRRLNTHIEALTRT